MYFPSFLSWQLWIADGTHAYVGSANMDWLSLSQVHQLSCSYFANCLMIGFVWMNG
jgi:hypothetical protein